MSDLDKFMAGFNQGPSIAQLVMMAMQNRDQRRADRAAEEEQAAQDEQMKLMMSLLMPQQETVTQGYSVPELQMSVPPENQQMYSGQGLTTEPITSTRYKTPEGTTLNEMYIPAIEAIQSGKLDPNMAYLLMNNLRGMYGDMYTPEEAPPEADTLDPNQLTLMMQALVSDPTSIDYFRSKPEYAEEVSLTGNMTTDQIQQFMGVEQPGKQPMGMMGGYGVSWNPETEQFEFQLPPGSAPGTLPPINDISQDGGPQMPREWVDNPEPAPMEEEDEYGPEVWVGNDPLTGEYIGAKFHQNLQTGEWEPVVNFDMGNQSFDESELPGPTKQEELINIIQGLSDAGKTKDEIIALLDASNISDAYKAWVKDMLEKVTL